MLTLPALPYSGNRGTTTGRLSSDSHMRLYVSLYQWQQSHRLCVGMLYLELNGYRVTVGEEEAAQPCGV
jgi:hypothetical protein